MAIERTDQWLLENFENPLRLCEKIKPYFEGADVNEIYVYFQQFGMYRKPFTSGKDFVENLRKKKIWEGVAEEHRQLQELWRGPNIPIFILPSEPNPRLLRDQNGKSGLAFKDKLFLFVSEQNDEKEIRALFTHEYNHVCRLVSYKKKEEEYTLLDTIILEGLAENAVRERFGEKYLANWTSYYSIGQLEQMWKRWILPNRNITMQNKRHFDLLYGENFYPKMLGYSAGYYLVKKFMEQNRLSVKDLLKEESSMLAGLKAS